MSDFAWDDGSIMDQIDETIKTLGWEPTDDIAVEVGGPPSMELMVQELSGHH